MIDFNVLLNQQDGLIQGGGGTGFDPPPPPIFLQTRKKLQNRYKQIFIYVFKVFCSPDRTNVLDTALTSNVA